MKQLVCLRARVDAAVYVFAELALFAGWWVLAFFFLASGQTEHWPWVWGPILSCTIFALMLAVMYLGFALHIARLRNAGYRWWAFWVWPCAWFLPSRE